VTAALQWGFDISAHCDSLADLGYTCMGCDADLATAHVTVAGGPWNRRVLLVLCRACLGTDQTAAAARVRILLADQVVNRRLDLTDGGPGAAGAAEARHGDHYDPLPQRC